MKKQQKFQVKFIKSDENLDLIIKKNILRLNVWMKVVGMALCYLYRLRKIYERSARVRAVSL